MPEVIKGAFVIGAEGGPGVLLARDAAGNWGYPAFYNVGAGSFGLQIGGQSAQVILVLRSQGAVESVVFHQGKLGADAQLTVGHVGAGMQASTTTNVGADIVGFSRAAGIFGGVSLEGGLISRRDDLNQAFYGPGATPQAIVLQHRFSNPQADGLRAALRVE
jgi:lipid-binding SYLF domain-containing protein